MANLFEFNDPVLYLQSLITENKTIKGYISKLAKAGACQNSYFSQFLRYKNHLSPEQATGISDFIGHSFLESEYFLNLILLQRSSTSSLKLKLEKKIETLRLQNLNLSDRILKEKITSDISHVYYSSWLYPSIHMALAIPDFETETISKLSFKFNIKSEKVIKIISDLESMGLLVKKNTRWILTDKQLHLPASSIMNYSNHQQWRQRALVDIELENEDSLHYSSAFALSIKDAVELKLIILKFLENSREKIKLSPSEVIYSFNLDYFKI